MGQRAIIHPPALIPGGVGTLATAREGKRSLPVALADNDSGACHDAYRQEVVAINAFSPRHQPVSTMSQGNRDRRLPASCRRDSTARIWESHGGDAVGKPLIGHVERSEPTQTPPVAVLTDTGTSWGQNFSSVPVGRAFPGCAISQFNDVNQSGAGLPA